MIVTAYFGMFRVGEIADSPHVMKAADVYIGDNKDKLMFILHSSKTHTKSDKPQIIKILAQEVGRNDQIKLHKHNICPFSIIDNYLKIRKPMKSKDEPFFVFKDKMPVGIAQFRKTLKLALSLAGFDETLYDTHSLRAGRSCDLMNMNVSIETIKKLGRWKSNAVFTYLR